MKFMEKWYRRAETQIKAHQRPEQKHRSTAAIQAKQQLRNREEHPFGRRPPGRSTQSSSWHTSSKEKQPHDRISCRSRGDTKTSHQSWYGGAWNNFYKVDSFHPIFNRFSTINSNNAGKVWGLWRHTQSSSIAFHHSANYQWWKSNKPWSISMG